MYINSVYMYTYLNKVYMYTNIIYIFIKYVITKQINAMTEEDSLFSFFTVYYSKSADKSQVHGKIMSSCNINKILHLTTLNYSMLQQSCPQATVTPPPPFQYILAKIKKIFHYKCIKLKFCINNFSIQKLQKSKVTLNLK